MNAWHNAEQQAQLAYGREQMLNGMNDDGISQRPIGYTGSQYGNAGGFDRHKSRQFGGERPQYQNADRRPQFNGEIVRPHQTQFERERGHMAFLKSLQRSSSLIRLVTILEEEVIGTLKDCDETTITVKVPKPTPTNPNAYLNRIFIKHNLVEFAPVVEGVTFN